MLHLRRSLMMLVVLALTTLPSKGVPEAKANCYTPHRVTIQYLGWMYMPGANPPYTCTYPNISPYVPPEVIGETVTECDGTQWSWGYTDASCQKNIVREACEQICE
jgi:hypothetical protein